MIKETADKLINLGYKKVIDTKDGISLVKEDISMCVIIVENYEDHLVYNNSDLREPLENKYPFANKGTMCIFKNPPEGKSISDIEEDPYDAIKIWHKNMKCVPHRKDKDITVEILPIECSEDYDNVMDLRMRGECELIDPFSSVDGKCSQDIYKYLANLKKDGKIYYPKCLEDNHLGWLRYITNKFYTEKTTR